MQYMCALVVKTYQIQCFNNSDFVNNLRKHITNEIYIFTWWRSKYCDYIYFSNFVICLCLHPNITTQAMNNLRTVKASHWFM